MERRSKGSSGSLVIVRRKDRTPCWEGTWYDSTRRKIKRRLGPAWVIEKPIGTLEEPGDLRDGWSARWEEPRTPTGRVKAAPDGFLTAIDATKQMHALIAAHEADLRAVKDAEQRAAEEEAQKAAQEADAALNVTFREASAAWLHWLEHIKGRKPATLANYRLLLIEPGTPYARRTKTPGEHAGLLLAALGDRPIREITTREISTFFDSLAAAGKSNRAINIYRQMLSSLFSYCMKLDTYELEKNPVQGTDKRAEPAPVHPDYFEPEELEVLARTMASGTWRKAEPQWIQDAIEGDDDERREMALSEREWRKWEDARDAELFRVLLYLGLRIGEAVSARWDQVDFDAGAIVVSRNLSAGIETTPKSGNARVVILPKAAAEALARLSLRGQYVGPDDYIFANRFGSRLDISALRKRFQAARAKAGLRPARLHDLRHAFGSILQNTAGNVSFVQNQMGHSSSRTTERYVGIKISDEHRRLVDEAFAQGTPAEVIEVEQDATIN